MTIFKTLRLTVRKLTAEDADAYFDMMRNPNVMDPIPVPVMTRAESDAHLMNFVLTNDTNPQKKIWAIDTQETNEFIGIAAFLTNDEGQNEIGYRLREKHWGLGFGTEIAKGLIDFGFEFKEMELISADVNTENLKSVKILEKFLFPTREFFNTNDNCVDRRYHLTKAQWLNKTS